MGRSLPKGDVTWHVPKRKTPIAYSTTATQNIIGLLTEEKPEATILEIFSKILYDKEAKDILKAYIDKGFGNVVASEWFKY